MDDNEVLDEKWMARLYEEHPGERAPTDAGALVDALARGVQLEELLLAARAYGRLIRAQGGEGCLSVERWLDGARAGALRS